MVCCGKMAECEGKPQGVVSGSSGLSPRADCGSAQNLTGHAPGRGTASGWRCQSGRVPQRASAIPGDTASNLGCRPRLGTRPAGSATRSQDIARHVTAGTAASRRGIRPRPLEIRVASGQGTRPANHTLPSVQVFAKKWQSSSVNTHRSRQPLTFDAFAIAARLLKGWSDGVLVVHPHCLCLCALWSWVSSAGKDTPTVP